MTMSPHELTDAAGESEECLPSSVPTDDELDRTRAARLQEQEEVR